jgi:hypothetical protein
MTDDGTGNTISIPSFIIRKKDADLIKKTLADQLNKQKVYIKAAQEMVAPDDRVEYELWYSSILDMEYDQLVDLAMY